MTARVYADRTYQQAATVVLETAVAEAVAVLRDATSPFHFDVAREGLLAAATTAEALLGRTS